MSEFTASPEEIRRQMDAFQNDRELYAYALRKVSKNTLGRGQWPVSNTGCGEYEERKTGGQTGPNGGQKPTEE